MMYLVRKLPSKILLNKVLSNHLNKILDVNLGNRGFHCGSTFFAGHSKWANIRHDKAKNDAKRSKQAAQMAFYITNSVRTHGIDGNPQLSTLLDKAKKLNVTKKIIDNAVKRGTGEITSEVSLTQEVTYEFMGPGAVAIIVEANTDNKNRTIALVKHAMGQFNALQSGCQYLFNKKGSVILEPKDPLETLDDLLEVAIEVGAEDVEEYKDDEGEYSENTKLFRLFAEPNETNALSKELVNKGYKLKDISIGYFAQTESLVEFPEEHSKGFLKAIKELDEIAEVTNYYTNIQD